VSEPLPVRLACCKWAAGAFRDHRLLQQFFEEQVFAKTTVAVI
jgi:hypothetical protein